MVGCIFSVTIVRTYIHFNPMPNSSKKLNGSDKCSGMTLIEVMIYVVLLSTLMSTFIRYGYDLHFRNMYLINTINDAQSK